MSFFFLKAANNPAISTQVNSLKAILTTYNNSIYKLSELIPQWYAASLNNTVRIYNK